MRTMTKLGIISDTHGRLNPNVWDVFSQVDYIVHAGDIGDPFILDELGGIAPVYACLGNNDRQDYGPSVGVYTTACLDGCRMLVTHLPRDAEREIRTGAYQLVIHGHTHVPRDEELNGCRIINPGSATRPRGGSVAQVAILELEDGQIKSFTYVAL